MARCTDKRKPCRIGLTNIEHVLGHPCNDNPALWRCPMNARVTPWLSSIAGLCLLASAVTGGDTKPTKKTIRADDGVDIVCEVRGKGDTALVFLHGWCGDREYWKNQVDVFAKDYRVVALDQAGHGESGQNRKTWTTSSLAGDVEAVVKALGLKRVIL